MKKIFIFGLVILSLSLYSNNIPYPIIFVHGLVGSDESFQETMEFLRDQYSLGNINVYDIVLNADDDVHESYMQSDVKWNDFYFDNDFINVGRRNFAEDIDDFVDGWVQSNIFAINFKEERIRGASGFWGDKFDGSNQAAIYKQGKALGKMIEDVLSYTQKDKVILVGHSMGGLAIREYLQRTDDGTQSSNHSWWINPNQSDGHKVARATTIGTPHLGCNIAEWPFSSREGIPNFDREALRDLRYLYNMTVPGIYLFGGDEANGNIGNYDNYDINCDGNENDIIHGINSSTSSTYNSSMPLPLNIKYTWITSDCIGVNGDRIVDLDRQWIYNNNNIPTPIEITDTLLTDRNHLNEGKDYYSILRGIDEPNQFELAYEIDIDLPVIGWITHQMNNLQIDSDMFKLYNEENSIINVYISGSQSSVNQLNVYDGNDNLIYSSIISALPFSYSFQNALIGDYYVEVKGIATNNSWENPYTMTISQSGVSVASFTISTDYLLANTPNPFNPSTKISFSITDDSKINLSIYNIKGEKIKTLIRNEYIRGNYSIVWNGDDESNKTVSSGIYFYKLSINGKTEAVNKCLLLK